jgi:hypothetical protein
MVFIVIPILITIITKRNKKKRDNKQIAQNEMDQTELITKQKKTINLII